MTIKRMDYVSVIVDDLPAAIGFRTTLGMRVSVRGADDSIKPGLKRSEPRGIIAKKNRKNPRSGR